MSFSIRTKIGNLFVRTIYRENTKDWDTFVYSSDFRFDLKSILQKHYFWELNSSAAFKKHLELCEELRLLGFKND
jgi:hypothetical protein